MTTYGIYTRNQAGTTIYVIGSYANIKEAYFEAKRQFKWYKNEKIVEVKP